MAPKAHGRLVFWEGASLWLLGTRPGEARYPKTALHAHHAIQVTIALRGGISLETRARRVDGAAVAIATDTEHTFEGDGVVAHLFIDPEGLAGRALARAWFSSEPIAPIPEERLRGLSARLLAGFEAPARTDAALIELGRGLLARLCPGDERDARPEARVRKMSAWAAARLDRPVSLVQAAEQVGLSGGRARHLFVAQTGLPFRTYLLWLRLMRAVELFSSGASLTDAACSAGFSDSAHLSRTFRRMFGITADSLRVL